MDAHRSGAWSLVAGSVIACLVFAFHPSHVDPRPLIGVFTLSQVVHAAAIVAAPLLLYGMWAMAEWIGMRSGAVRCALVLAGFAMLLTANAAVVSSFVTPAAAQASGVVGHAAPRSESTLAPHGATRDAAAPQAHAMPPLVQVTVALNRGLAQAHVATLSLALLLFAWALRARGALLAGSGAVVAAFPLLWQASGTFSPSTQSMPPIVFSQSAWLVAVALLMLRSPTPSGDN